MVSRYLPAKKVDPWCEYRDMGCDDGNSPLGSRAWIRLFCPICLYHGDAEYSGVAESLQVFTVAAPCHGIGS